jgi:hypothetical protein
MSLATTGRELIFFRVCVKPAGLSTSDFFSAQEGRWTNRRRQAPRHEAPILLAGLHPV